MKKYSALIVEDEPKQRKVLEVKLEKFCPEIIVKDIAESLAEAKTKINNINPNIIFLDISLPDGTAFDLLEHIENPNFEIIFVTGFGDYAYDAIQKNPVGFIKKPLRTEHLLKAVSKAITKLEQRQKLEDYENLIQQQQNHNQQQRLEIPGLNEKKFIQINQIIRCEGWQRYTKIYLENQEELISSYNIGVFEELLNPFLFYKTHKSHLINTSNILRKEI